MENQTLSPTHSSDSKYHLPIQRKLALGILVGCAIALLVGVLNAISIQLTKTPLLSSPSVKSSVASLLVKSDHLMEVDLTGPIFMSAPQEAGGDMFQTETNAMMAKKSLDKALEDDSIKGVLVRIDSPGGTVGMSQELNRAIQRLSKKKPVVASLGDTAASGGYYTACAADKIIANKGTLTASIGVIISTMNMKGLMEDKLGIKTITIKSGKFKDILSPNRPPTAEDIALIQRLIDDSYADFLGAVVEGRTRFLTSETEKTARIKTIKAVADGRVVHGKEAIKAGLVDEIGDMKDAYELLDKMAKERFHLSDHGKLPLEPAVKSPTILDFLGITGDESAHLGGLLPKMSSPGYKELLPISMRYPNQPLWIME